MSERSGLEESRSNSAILVAEDLRKSYGRRPAVRGLSFSLNAGSVLGFLGPNGAGKTTSIRILTTMLEPSAGRFSVDGIPSDHADRIRGRIGVLPEAMGFHKQMTGIEYLTFFGQLYGRGAREARAHGLRLLEDVGLQHRAKSLIGSYSHGMRRRLGIARALVNDPVVVFLDEPTQGLDPRGQEELLALVRRVAQDRNAGVILCSHLLWEVERVCDDVVILSSGEVVASGTVADVVGRGRSNVMRIHVPATSLLEAQRVLETAPEVTKTAPVDQMTGWLRVELDRGGAVDQDVKNAVLDALIRAQVPILGFEAEGSRLQDVFLQVTERGTR